MYSIMRFSWSFLIVSCYFCNALLRSFGVIMPSLSVSKYVKTSINYYSLSMFFIFLYLRDKIPSHKWEKLSKIYCAIPISVDLLDEHLDFIFAWVLAKRAHDFSELLKYQRLLLWLSLNCHHFSHTFEITFSTLQSAALWNYRTLWVQKRKVNWVIM